MEMKSEAVAVDTRVAYHNRPKHRSHGWPAHDWNRRRNYRSPPPLT